MSIDRYAGKKLRNKQCLFNETDSLQVHLFNGRTASLGADIQRGMSALV